LRPAVTYKSFIKRTIVGGNGYPGLTIRLDDGTL
jgi:hypothetical protein